jgi:transcription initiation factor TFIID subunit 6
VEGVQPSIPQNPTTAEARTQELVPKGANANPTLAALTGNDNVGFKPQVKHILSKELMLYFDKIRSAILDTDPDEDVVRLRVAALASVENDESLQQLVPYFVQFIAEKVTHNIRNIFVLQTMMELTSALTRNERLFMDPYTTTLCSSVLTCLIGRGIPGATSDEIRDQYKLREYSASLIGHIAKKYAKSSQQLKPRLARTFLKYFLDPRKPLDQQYGAIIGLSAVGGPEAVRMLVIPNLKAYNGVLARGQTESPLDAEMVVGALVKAVRSIVDEGILLTNGNGAAGDDLGAEVEEFVGPIVGAQIVRLGDHKLEKAVLECKN